MIYKKKNIVQSNLSIFGKLEWFKQFSLFFIHLKKIRNLLDEKYLNGQ